MLNPINYLYVYVFYKRALPKLPITPYVCVTSRLTWVFSTTRVHLFLAESGMPVWDWKWTPVENGPPVHFYALKMDPPPPLCKMDPPPPPGPFFAVENVPPVHFHPLKMDPRSIFTRWKWTPGPFSPVENGPPGQLFAVENGPPPRKVRNIANVTPGNREPSRSSKK